MHNIRQIESYESLELDIRISKLQFRRGQTVVFVGSAAKHSLFHLIPLEMRWYLI